MIKFEILKLINNNNNWKQILSSNPYNLIIKEDGDYILIKYNQITSDFSKKIVREARGIIIKKHRNKYKFVCVPFTKFFCVGDPCAKPSLIKLFHRKTWLVEEKIDGSLIKLWFDNNEWHISTSGTIDAKKASIQFTKDNINNYKALFLKASKEKIDYDKLNKQYTYMFELIGMENKVIVPYKNTDIYYLGRRNNYTLKEVSYYEDTCTGVSRCRRPICYKFKVKAPKYDMKLWQNKAKFLTMDDENFEGYVISDVSLKTRVKIKSSQYMELFCQKGNGVFTPRKILLMILDNKDDDFISMFPEFKNQFDDIRRALCIWLEKVKEGLRYMDTHTWSSKKEFAVFAKTQCCPAILFKAYDADYWQDEWLENQIKNISIQNLLIYIGINEKKED